MKPNRYAKATIPEPKVLRLPKGTNRKERRKLFFSPCPCGSGKRFYKCHLPIERKRRKLLAKKLAEDAIKKVDKKGGKSE